MSAASVTITELDLTTIVPSFPGLYIGIVIPSAAKGPINTPLLCTNTSQFLKRFTPNNTIEVGYDNAYYSALAVLQSSNKLWAIRPNSTGLNYGGLTVQSQATATPAAGITDGVPNPLAYSFGAESFIVTGTDPGAYNNDISIQVLNYKAPETVTINATTNIITVTQSWGTGFPVRVVASSGGTLPSPLSEQSTYFAIYISATTIKLAATQSGAYAGTSITFTTTGSGTYILAPAINYTSQPNTFAINVFNKGLQVESWICSKSTSLLNSRGSNIYIQNVMTASNYINVEDNVLVSDVYTFDQVQPVNLTGGSDDYFCLDGDCINAINTLAGNNTPLTVIIDGGRATVNYHNALITLAETRMDCVAILSTAFEDEDNANYLNSVVNYVLFNLNSGSSYAAIYSPHVWIYDIYNDRNLYVSPDGFIAGLISKTASNFALWWPVAGFRRGVMNVIDVRRRWTSGEMDYLYDNNINPIRYAPGRGIVVWGQKTLYRHASVLNRLNVRLLAIAIEPAIKIALEDFLFEFNDALTRSNIVTILNTYMTGIKSGRGVTSYSVVCDNSNNSNSDIQNNILNVYLFIVPTESTEEIKFKLVFTPNGMSFSMAQSLV